MTRVAAETRPRVGPGEGLEAKAAWAHTQDSGRAVFLAPVGRRCDRSVPKGQDPEDRQRQVLVVKRRKATDRHHLFTQRWCGSDKRESRHHLFTESEAWRPQIRRLWRRVGKDCGWKRPRAPAVRKLWREEATEAVLEFLRDTRVGCWTASRGAGRPAEEADQGDGGEEGGPGPP